MTLESGRRARVPNAEQTKGLTIYGVILALQQGPVKPTIAEHSVLCDRRLGSAPAGNQRVPERTTMRSRNLTSCWCFRETVDVGSSGTHSRELGELAPNSWRPSLLEIRGEAFN